MSGMDVVTNFAMNIAIEFLNYTSVISQAMSSQKLQDYILFKTW